MKDNMRPTGFLKKWQVSSGVWRKNFWVWSVFVLGSAGISDVALAATLNQEDFENGERSPWGIFVTSNGTIGGDGLPTVVIFDTVQEGKESKSLKFKVGQMRYNSEKTTEQGGGLVIEMETDGGYATPLCECRCVLSLAQRYAQLSGRSV